MSRKSLIVVVAAMALPMAAWPGAASNLAAGAAPGQRVVVTPHVGFTLSQTITFNTLNNMAVGDSQLLQATASSGLAVTFASSPSSVCTVNTVLTTSGPAWALFGIGIGSCSVTASQAGGSGYKAAPDVTQTIQIAGESQTIAFTAPTSMQVGYVQNLIATASSGLPVSFGSSTPSFCTVPSGGMAVTSVAIGTCIVVASQPGNSTYAAAPIVSKIFLVNGETQTIGTITATGGGKVGDSQTLSATASSGLPVSFNSQTNNTCTVSGSTVALIAVGTCTVQATQPGDGYIWAAAAPVTKSGTVLQGTQTIINYTLNGPATEKVGDQYTIGAFATSGLPVSFNSQTPTVCTLSGTASGSTLTLIAGGTCAPQATQAGNVNWAAATPVSAPFTVHPGAQTITFNALVGLGVGSKQVIVASASSGLPVTSTTLTPTVCSVGKDTGGPIVTALAMGTCTVEATQAGNTSYAAATPVDRSFLVQGESQTITFNPLTTPMAVGNGQDIKANASSGLDVQFQSQTTSVCTVGGLKVVSGHSIALLTAVAVGTCTVQASQAGDGITYAAAPTQTQNVQVTAAPLTAQTITFNPLADQTLGAAPFNVGATSTSGLPVSFASLTTPVCTVAGSMVTLVAVGTCTIQATQAGNATYAAATPVDQGFTVNPAGTPSPAPVIAALVNNYSNINPAAPNYGIAPGMLMDIWGSNLAAPGSAAILQNPATNLPLELNGSSVSVTVGGKTVTPAFYFAIPGELGVVLPSSTPIGTGTIAVSYGGQTSAAFPITVVASAFGFDYYNGALGVATDNLDGHLITPTDSAQPGETIDFWGSGDGADPRNTDVGPPTDWTPLTGITALYLGGVPVPITYQGRSGQFQGVDQVIVVVPANAPTGCAVSVSAVMGSGSSAMASNLVTMPISANGGACTDGPLSSITPAEAATLSGQGTVAFGVIEVGQTTGPGASGTTTTDSASALFDSLAGASLAGYQSAIEPSLGSCFVVQNMPGASSLFSTTGLNPGMVTVQGPVGGPQALTAVSTVAGDYQANPLPASFIPAAGGTFTFTGTGAGGVGAFSEGLSAPAPLVWTNAGSLATVTRSQGVTVAWTGGGSGYVVIGGGTAPSAAFPAGFVCDAAASAQTFTVPPAVLLALPAGAGSLSVSGYTFPRGFTVTGLDFAFASAFATTEIEATYN